MKQSLKRMLAWGLLLIMAAASMGCSWNDLYLWKESRETAATAPAETPTVVVMETESAETPEEAVAETETASDALPDAAAGGEAEGTPVEPAATEPDPAEAVCYTFTDTGATGVLFAADIPYARDFSADSPLLKGDFDGDGTEETVCAGAIDTETDCLCFYAGAERGEAREETDIFQLTRIAAARLSDGGAVKLLICGDYGSDDYMTYVFGVVGDTLTMEDMMEARFATEGDTLLFHERYECLGTRDGVRAYAGDPLQPVTETLTSADIPTEEELATDREALIDMGILLKSKVELTAVGEDGTETTLPSGTYLYLVSFLETLERIWVKTEEGTLYSLETKLPMGGWVMTVNGLPEDMCFSNLSYAD